MFSQFAGLKILLLSLVIVFASLVELQAQAEWKALYHRDHQLVGKIFSTKDKRWISGQTLNEKIKSTQFLLLGETHTNPDHHSGQARIIQAWLKDQTATALVLEMLAYDNWHERLPHLEIEALTEKLQQVSEGWKWPLYQPILELQIEHKLPMLGGNLTRAQLDKFSSGASCEVKRDGVVVNVCLALDELRKQTVKQLIYDAHCGYLPMEHTQSMMYVQLAKDASFSITMAEMVQTHQVALIAGAIHVRKDIGVPVHLHALGYSSIASIAFINVKKDKFEINQYFEGNDPSSQYDYVIFTPSDTNQDPCEEFAEQLKKMRH